MTAADITAARHGGNPHSTAAAASIDKAAIRAKVLAVIAAAGDTGRTSDEAEQALDMPHQTVSARFTELAASGAIQRAGRRPTRSGRTAAVWVAAPVQQELWAG